MFLTLFTMAFVIIIICEEVWAFLDFYTILFPY